MVAIRHAYRCVPGHCSPGLSVSEQRVPVEREPASEGQKLLKEIDAFLRRNQGISESGFGVAVCNDGHWLKKLRHDGYEPRAATREKVRAFMRARDGRK